MERSITDVPDARPPSGRSRVDLTNPTLVSQWLAETRAALSLLTHAARDACSRERVYSRSELRRRVKRADRLMRSLLSEADLAFAPSGCPSEPPVNGAGRADTVEDGAP